MRTLLPALMHCATTVEKKDENDLAGGVWIAFYPLFDLPH